ncbi:putative MATE family efflux protein [Nitrospirillum amazonense]|uniref:Putative MATE family efflux protein n=1 Tax=Nitrospirillum amazonense TaxID=28077 RepID=A0A560FPK7_9PROT|nr:MATE family efflux transporter [Nitrospirillum amazonense]TWB23532.1 putative MATE family efflux protein [Nitrospirillum amazonense]
MTTDIGTTPAETLSGAGEGARVEPKPVPPARHALLHGPIVPTMLRLALPTIVVLLIQTAVGVAETYYVSALGTDALVGAALVLPVSMLMTMVAAGGIGGGVAAAVSRAMGAGRVRDANALVLHALVLAVAFGLVFTLALRLGGPALYRLLGGTDGALAAALSYSGWLFAGAVPVWIINLMSAVLRGIGNVRVPALVTLVGAAVMIPLSPFLIFGIGPVHGFSVHGFGVAGAGMAVSGYYTVAAVVLLAYMARGRSGLTLRRVPLEGRLFRDILGVGVVSALSALQLNLITLLVTGAVGRFGTAALAGFGMGSRLDYLLIPLLFGLGTAVLTLVGTAMGAGNQARARRAAWIGALMGAAVTEAIGLGVALWPSAWVDLFSHDPAVLAHGAHYLRTVGPVYGAVGLTFILGFASQGGGRPLWAFLAGTVRLIVAAGLGWLAVGLGAGLDVLFGLVAAASLASAALCVAATLSGAIWRPGRE